MCAISDKSGLLPTCMMASVISPDNAVYFPPFQFVKKFMTRKAHLAHEKLVQFVGVC